MGITVSYDSSSSRSALNPRHGVGNRRPCLVCCRRRLCSKASQCRTQRCIRALRPDSPGLAAADTARIRQVASLTLCTSVRRWSLGAMDHPPLEIPSTPPGTRQGTATLGVFFFSRSCFRTIYIQVRVYTVYSCRAWRLAGLVGSGVLGLVVGCTLKGSRV
jgi:hypothetical protein